jgi:hypothetical protein
VFTNTQANLYLTSSLGGINIGTLFSTTYGGNHQTDAISGGVNVPIGATNGQSTGVAGYCSTAANSSGRTIGNCAGLFGLAYVAANNAAGWGMNTIIFDVATASGHNMTGYENDMNLLGSPGYFKGFFLTGLNQGGTLPASATAYENALPYQVPKVFVSDRGSGLNGVVLDCTVNTNPCSSQTLQLIGHDGGGTAHIGQLQADANGNYQFNNAFSSYNNVPTVGQGLVPEYAFVDLTVQSAAIATTTLYAVPGAGQYRLSWDAKVTTAATTSCQLGALTIVYTDPDGVVQTITAGAQVPAGTIATNSTVNTTANVLLGLPMMLNVKASTNITYAFAYTSVGGTAMQYNLHIRLEAL